MLQFRVCHTMLRSTYAILSHLCCSEHCSAYMLMSVSSELCSALNGKPVASLLVRVDAESLSRACSYSYTVRKLVYTIVADVLTTTAIVHTCVCIRYRT
jgi:hypothetical protein